MKQKCKVSKKRDRGPVIKGMFPDIQKMIQEHTIPDTGSDVVYNELSELKDVGYRVNDDFDAIMLSRKLKGALTASGGTGSSQAAGATAPVASSNSSE